MPKPAFFLKVLLQVSTTQNDHFPEPKQFKQKISYL